MNEIINSFSGTEGAVRFERVSGLQQFYVPFSRVDDTEHLIEGYCFTSGRVAGDKWNLLPETLKRSAAAYMEMPCVRAMHQPIAAGVATGVEFDEDGRCKITARIVDENEWKKVESGVYRGFSLGGKPLLVRGSDIHEFDWQETSLVDRPADAGCRFTLVRAEDADPAADYVVRVESETPFMPDEELEVYGRAGAVDNSERAPDLPEQVTEAPLSRRMEDWLGRLEQRFEELDQLIAASTSVVESRHGGAEFAAPAADYVTRADYEAVELQRSELAGRYERARQDLARVAGDMELLRGELAQAKAKIERLEKTPVSQQMPQRYAGGPPRAVERSFAANEWLPEVSAEEGAMTDLAHLLREKNELMQRGATGDVPAEQRSLDATRLSAIDIELVHRFGVVPS